MTENIREYDLGTIKLYYRIDKKTKEVGLSLQSTIKPANTYKNMEITNLFQVKKIGDKYPKGFSNGRTMINSESSATVKFVEQFFSEDSEKVIIETQAIDNNRNKYKNTIEYFKEYNVIETWNEFECQNDKGEQIEYFPSVTIEGISPYTIDGDKIHLTKYRSQWAMEGKRDTQSFANLFLEQCWKPSGVSVEKFGYTGSMPVNGFFPMVSTHDEEANFSMSVQLHAISSWQIEVYNKERCSSLSLGLADRNFGDVLYILKKHQTIITPRVRVAIEIGSVDDCNRRLVNMQEKSYRNVDNFDMPIIFNEFCSTWGAPTHENVIGRAKVASELGLDYYVIDAGWYNDINENADMTIGDWELNKGKFPKGLKQIKSELKNLNIKLGIWFEFENCAQNSNVYKNEDMMLTRDGLVLETVKRRFFDFKKEKTIKYMDKKVHEFINENKIDYVKIDYNDSIGYGVDHPISPGLGVIESVGANYKYYKSLIARNPNVLFENCASGGHRLTLPFTEITNMSSFSDAHETVGIPIVAANLSTLFLIKQMQIWAVLKPEYSNQKLRYILASTFIGRMCISGLIESLNDRQLFLVKEYVNYYKELKEIILNSDCYVSRSFEGSYNTPKGYQVVEVRHRLINDKYFVIQSFDLDGKEEIVDLGNVNIVSKLASEHIAISNNKVKLVNNFDSIIVRVKENRG